MNDTGTLLIATVGIAFGVVLVVCVIGSIVFRNDVYSFWSHWPLNPLRRYDKILTEDNNVRMIRRSDGKMSPGVNAFSGDRAMENFSAKRNIETGRRDE